uniref:UPAR/Ly6 domain-containing protein n=1 Tax=Loxodonta africana TaxID=9785 RepID=G3U3I9_LOXAF
MGKHLLLLLLNLSLLLGFLQALYCQKCAYVKPDGSCLGQRTACRAPDQGECLLKNSSSGNSVVFGFQDCRLMCHNVTIRRRVLLAVTSCCKDRDFCNAF